MPFSRPAAAIGSNSGGALSGVGSAPGSSDSPSASKKDQRATLQDDRRRRAQCAYLNSIVTAQITVSSGPPSSTGVSRAFQSVHA
jgi:hypothetical protein